jgi:ATP-dependent helicase HrpA
VFNGFVTATGYPRLSDVARYLTAILRRLDKLAERPARDADWTYAVQGVWEAYEEARTQLGDDPKLEDVRWMIEELRVSYFAQTLKTAYPVSEKRIYRAIDEALGY